MWQKVTAHPVTPIVVGVLLAMDTAGNVALKSYGFIALWLWLCVDAALWIKEKTQWKKAWRLVIFQAAFGVSALIALVAIYELKSLKLQETQEDTFNNIEAVVRSPLAGSGPGFTISNKSKYTIGKHQIICNLNLGVGKTNIFDRVRGNPVVGDAPIFGGGDSETAFCLAPLIGLVGGQGIVCADLTLEVDYALAIQPERYIQKLFRFAGYAGDASSAISWYPQRVNDPQSFCLAFARKIMYPPTPTSR